MLGELAELRNIMEKDTREWADCFRGRLLRQTLRKAQNRHHDQRPPARPPARPDLRVARGTKSELL